jgi:hypothetical protein
LEHFLDIVIIILNVLTILAIFIVAMVGKNYLPRYVSEKAKNLATKEDVAEITNKIESVKIEYAKSLEEVKSELHVKSALQQAFQSKGLDAIVAINDLLVELNLYCWKEIADRSPAEHYVWRNVDESDSNKGLHYYTVAIDKINMVHGLYLTRKAQNSLSELSSYIGSLSNMELALSGPDPDPIIEESASHNYGLAIEAIEQCRNDLMTELSINNKS